MKGHAGLRFTVEQSLVAGIQPRRAFHTAALIAKAAMATVGRGAPRLAKGAAAFSLWFAGAAFLTTTAALAQQASVFERYGNIHYRAADRSTRQLTRDGKNGEPVLAPDGRTIAFIHLDSAATGEGESGYTSLGIADGPTGAVRRLIGPRPHAEPKHNFASFGNPVFSLDGGYVYVDADAWTTSSAALTSPGVKYAPDRF